MPLTNHFAPSPGKLSYRSGLGTTPFVSVTALTGVPQFVREAFGERLLRRANEAAMLDIEAIEDQDCFIPHITMTTFANTVAKLSGEENFGLIVAPHLSIANYGCWGEYMLGAPTLGGAIERAIATMAFHSKGDVMSLTIAGGEAQLSYESAAKGMEGYPHIACGTAGVLVSICRAFLPVHWQPQRIELDVARPRHPGIFEDIFECPVLFNAPKVSVCLETNRLRSAPREPRHSLLTVGDLARARVEIRKLTGLRDIIAQQIWSQVLTGNVSIESAARSLGTSIRTLQRALNQEGTDFRSLANAMRTRRAMELLQETDASITHISMILGYAAPPHFSRAFRNTTGMSPQEFRQRSSPAVPTRVPMLARQRCA
jgi:AraC-like DNA-binding protein